jgi:hypothetical protein
MQAGVQWSALWMRGEELVCFESMPWIDSTGGYGFTECDAPIGGWMPGEYTINLFVGKEFKQSGSFTIAGALPVPSATPTLNRTPTLTRTPTPSSTASPLPTATRIVSATPSSTPAPSNTPRPTDTRWPSMTPIGAR